jgi:hypothetical protein
LAASSTLLSNPYLSGRFILLLSSVVWGQLEERDAGQSSVSRF